MTVHQQPEGHKKMEVAAEKPTRILRWPEVHDRIGLSHSQVYNLIKQNDYEGNALFPAPIKLGARASGWLESDIEGWISRRVIASRGCES